MAWVNQQDLAAKSALKEIAHDLFADRSRFGAGANESNTARLKQCIEVSNSHDGPCLTIVRLMSDLENPGPYLPENAATMQLL